MKNYDNQIFNYEKYLLKSSSETTIRSECTGKLFNVFNIQKMQDRLFDYIVAVVFEAIGYIIKLYHHRQHKKYTVRDSINEVV